ncbi:hypothetical protein GCM10011609_88360 [Lentzea pudingi]|uniref:Uncharacterized protein n=1 Tax=Lentzea pudingi TaxID=1789439 RepID=A0ABQ2IU20_9PSEU|nr:hypothetical protein [Lentzea pudingi]GGN30515.1 hypothetical protein GCM10011609_88360 [Lentzea pudingi]
MPDRIEAETDRLTSTCENAVPSVVPLRADRDVWSQDSSGFEHLDAAVGIAH